jgi:DNA-binding transcriptional LysR family regulator
VRFKTVAEQSLAAIQIVRKEFEQARDEGGTPAIRFAALHTLALVLFPRWIGACERQIGPIRSSLMAANLAECVASLAAGECDFLLSYVDPDEQPSATKLGFSSLHITYDQLVPVSSVENGRPTLSLVGEAPIPYLSYGPDTLLGRLTQKALDRGGGQALLDVRYENSMSEALKVMALQGAGVAWLPVDSVGDDLQSGALALAGGEAWAVDLEVRIYRRRATLSKPAERLWRSLEAR